MVLTADFSGHTFLAWNSKILIMNDPLPGRRVSTFSICADDPKIFEYYAQEKMTEEGVDFIRDKGNRRIIWFTHRIRQVGVVDAQGRAATYDGACNNPIFASLAGDGFSCQGGRLVSKDVVTEMASAFQKARCESKTMLKSLLAALQAGEAMGGDKKGNKAAALLVVREKGHWSGMDRFCDVRVDEDDHAVARLAKLTEYYEPG